MDIRKLSVNLTIFGLVVTVVAVAWWFFYFKSLSQDSLRQELTLSDIAPCLYKSDPICDGAKVFHDASRIIRGLADPGAPKETSALPAYEPKAFWFGLIVFLGGLLMRFSVRT